MGPKEGWLRPVSRRTDCRYPTQRMEEANKKRRGGLWQNPAKTWEGLWEDESWALRPSLVEGKRKENRALLSFFSMRSTPGGWQDRSVGKGACKPTT